jgi:4-aminobutyrate aminotransferase
MIGVELPDHHAMIAVEQAAFRRGLLALGCGESTIRMSPALTFREDQARTALRLFEGALADVEGAGEAG